MAIQSIIKCFFVIIVFSLLADTFASDGYTEVKLDDNYKVWWKFENSTDTFHFKVEVLATGWIGFGITLLNKGPNPWMRGAMMKYDVLVAGVHNGKNYSQDYLTAYLNTSQAPHIDDRNDWEITDAKEDGGKTILEFKRQRKTEDPMNIHNPPFKGDIEITPGERNFVWAYHESMDAPNGNLSDVSFKHTKSGIKPVTLIKLDEKEPIYITYPPEEKRSNKGSSIPVMSAFTFIFGSLLTLVTACIL